MATSPPAPRGWQLSTTVQACQNAGRIPGREYGLAESRAATLARLLRRQARQRFQQEDPAANALLDSLVQGFAGDLLEDLGERLLTAGNSSTWLAGVVAPPPAPGFPDYARDLEFDIEPEPSSIDSLMRGEIKGGKEMIFLIRMQKWYEPDFDRLQFQEALRLEGLHGIRPQVLVVLLWPSADGPGITGRYLGTDHSGKKTTFTYTVRRTWEMLPEEALVAPSTMMFATLARGAKKRMPEILDRIDKGISDHPDKRLREAVWVTTYWAMGMVCTLEEAHAALGDRLAIIQAIKDYRTAQGNCFLSGHEEGMKDGPLLAARALLLRQGRIRFGSDSDQEAKLTAIDQMPVLEGMVRQILTAPDWATLLASAGASSSGGGREPA